VKVRKYFDGGESHCSMELTAVGDGVG